MLGLGSACVLSGYYLGQLCVRKHILLKSEDKWAASPAHTHTHTHSEWNLLRIYISVEIVRSTYNNVQYNGTLDMCIVTVETVWN